MSFKTQIRYQTRYFIQFLYSFSLPAWLESAKTKVIIAGLVATLVVGYVFQTNSMATQGYIVHNLEQEIAELQSEAEKLETKVASYQSMTSIQKRLVKEDYVSAEPSKFIKTVGDTSVAKR